MDSFCANNTSQANAKWGILVLETFWSPAQIFRVLKPLSCIDLHGHLFKIFFFFLGRELLIVLSAS